MSLVRNAARIVVVAGVLCAASAAPASADTCYLDTVGSSCGPAQGNSAFNAMGAIFQQISSQTPGNVFLKLQPASGTSEQGFNTDGALTMDQIDTGNGTHSITKSQVPVVTINSVNYRQFFLDVNEPTALPRLSLDKLQIFLGAANLTGYSSGKLNNISPIFDLDTGSVDRWIKLDYTLNPTGVGDMVAYIPDSLFTAAYGTNPNVYLYSQFGSNWSADGGFEEWWVNSPLAPQGGGSVPEPTGLLLLGSGLLLAGKRIRRATSRQMADKAGGEPTKVTGSAELTLSNP